MAEKNRYGIGQEPDWSPLRPQNKPAWEVSLWNPSNTPPQEEPTQTTKTPGVDLSVPQADLSDYNTLNDLVEKYYAGAVLSPKEQARRERAATAAQGVGALGNAISAFSNIAFTGGVAPSQKLPELPDANKDIQAFRAQVDKNRAAYVNAMLAVKGLKNKAQNTALRQAEYQRKVYNDAVAAQNKKDLNDATIGFKRAQAAKDEAMQSYYQTKEEALREGMPLDLAEKRARTALYNYRAQGGGSSGGGNRVPIQIVDNATGELKTIYVTGNEAKRYYESLYPDDSNTSKSTSSESYGGTEVSKKTTERETGKTARAKSGEATLEARKKAEEEKKKKKEKGFASDLKL